MEIVDIRNWLNNTSDYKKGVELYRLFGKNNTLLELFASSNNVFTRKKLLNELTVIYNAIPVKKASIKINPTELTPELKTEYNKLGDIIREIGYLHGKISAFTDKKKRYLTAERIVFLAEQRRFIFNRIDLFVATGIDSEKTVTPVIDENIELINFRLNKELEVLRVKRYRLSKNTKKAVEYAAVCKKIEVLTQQKNG